MSYHSRAGLLPLCVIAAAVFAVTADTASGARPSPVLPTIPSSSAPSTKASSPSAADTAYFTDDTGAHVVGLKYVGVLAAVYFIIEGHIATTSLLPPPLTVGWALNGPYTNVLISPFLSGPGPWPSIGTGLLFSYTGTGKIVWAEAADTLGRLVPIEFPGGAYHGCGYQWSGNVDCDPSQLVDIADLTRLIDNLFISQDSLCCEGEANCDGLPGVDVSDVTRLIDFLFISGTPPAPCR